MAKYTSEDIRKIAERLKGARDRDRPAHFLLGAGCSISAGIPGAADLIKRIHKDYPAHCAELSLESRDLYGACMALLSLNERRDLIKPYLENAKINWGTIALAQLIANNFIGRVLTANFDLVLENACGLLGLQPAVYDFGVAPANDPEIIVSPSIIHLHGQSYGLVLLNTDEETKKHREKLRPILTDSLRNAPLVVMGYSGSADGIFQTLFDEFEGRERLYWASYEEEPKPHIRPFLEKNHFQFIGGADFDRFMIELAQSLGCWPPNLFANPLGHLIDGLSPVVSYPLTDSENAIDLLADLRRKLESWREKLNAEESPAGTLQKFFMKGQFKEAVEEFSSRTDRSSISDEDKDIAVWSFIMLGNSQFEQAKRASGEEAARLFTVAAEKYQAAVTIKPDRHEALYNWGNLLFEQAERASGEDAARLIAVAAEKYQAALMIKPDRHEVLNNWGSLLLEQAKLASGEEAAQLFAAAAEKYQAALTIKPGKDEALYNWGSLLFEQAKRASGEEAARLFAAAVEKYQAALTIKPVKHEALNNWGSLLSEQAERASGEEAARLFVAAAEKYQAALTVKPDSHDALNNWGSLLLERAKHAAGADAMPLLVEAGEKLAAAVKINPANTYNLACLAALLGDETKCRQNLENAERCGTLPDAEHLTADTDLDVVRDKPWFQELLRRQKENG
jgi:Tfp pilus assembly protein PilF